MSLVLGDDRAAKAIVQAHQAHIDILANGTGDADARRAQRDVVVIQEDMIVCSSAATPTAGV